MSTTDQERRGITSNRTAFLVACALRRFSWIQVRQAANTVLGVSSDKTFWGKVQSVRKLDATLEMHLKLSCFDPLEKDMPEVLKLNQRQYLDACAVVRAMIFAYNHDAHCDHESLRLIPVITDHFASQGTWFYDLAGIAGSLVTNPKLDTIVGILSEAFVDSFGWNLSEEEEIKTMPLADLDRPIQDLNLSVRAYTTLKKAGIHKIGQILEMSEEELLAIRGFGEKAFRDLIEKLENAGYRKVDQPTKPTGVGDEEPEGESDLDDGGDEEPEISSPFLNLGGEDDGPKQA